MLISSREKPKRMKQKQEKRTLKNYPSFCTFSSIDFSTRTKKTFISFDIWVQRHLRRSVSTPLLLKSQHGWRPSGRLNPPSSPIHTSDFWSQKAHECINSRGLLSTHQMSAAQTSSTRSDPLAKSHSKTCVSARRLWDWFDVEREWTGMIRFPADGVVPSASAADAPLGDNEDDMFRQPGERSHLTAQLHSWDPVGIY